jgi:hypothetical protein
MTSKNKKITEQRREVLLRILEITGMYADNVEQEKAMPTEDQIRMLDEFLERRGITPERYEKYYLETFGKPDELHEDEPYTLSNGVQFTGDALDLLPPAQSQAIMLEAYATEAGMTVRELEKKLARQRKLPGMFKGKKIKPEDIVDEVKKR